MWQNKRCKDQELIDLGPDYYTPKEYDQCLTLLSRVNLLLGGFKATKKAFKALNTTPQTILEVGCGGGYLSRYLNSLYPQAKIRGIDISEKAIIHAKKGLSNENIAFHLQKDKTLDYQENAFDVVTTLLVCHHMTDDELITFLKESYRICSDAVIINDLHRHILAYISFSLVTPFAFPNRLIWHDGRLSVRRSFRKKEWIALLTKAGFNKNQYTLKWRWAFRWTLTLKKW
ncbi:methyltransferase domain-containing protein [Chlamydiales bacterium]|nr:methyltransferase domain-containing protein [Chlamydiales bacterium]